ncbi:MAG: hypothetical protein LBB43_00720 [Spirochaetaceae bacterium]|jgi:hypothetical protein|nr:hypothetical protein [Spirochaetaceae bacterium]
MYYLAATDQSIKNHLFKAELLKIGLERYAQSNQTVDLAILALGNQSSQRVQSYSMLLYEYKYSCYQYILAILPFIKYEY